MSYFFWETSRWFRGALCCRYLAIRFDRFRIPMRSDGAVSTAEWHWALGFFTDGQCQVLGAWQDEGRGTAQRIASDLHDRGIERVNAIAAQDDLTMAMTCLRPKVCRNTPEELIESGVFGPRMLRVIRWTDVAGQHLQGRMSRAAKRQTPLVDAAAAADFVARHFQRADRALLHDMWERKKPMRYGQAAFLASQGGG